MDRVTGERIAGWSAWPKVEVSVNGAARCILACDGYRPDVQAAGLSADGRVGFDGSVTLAAGDIVRIRTHPDARPLRNSPWIHAGSHETCWFPAEVAAQNPEYQRIAQLAGNLSFDYFRPHFGQLGQVAGAGIKVTGSRPRMARLNVPTRNACNVEFLYEQVLRPFGIESPPLLATLPESDRVVQVFGYVDGAVLDDLPTASWEAPVNATLAALGKLQTAGEQLHPRLARRPGRKHPIVRMVIRPTLQSAARTPGEWPFLCSLFHRIRGLPRVLSHGDLHRANVLVENDGDRVVMLDWDQWGYLPVGFDPALLLRGLAWRDVERWVVGSRTYLQGALMFTYLFKRLDEPGFVHSGEGQGLRQRIRDLG